MPPAKHPPPDRPCVICGAIYSPRNRRATTCSPACQRERKRRCGAAWYALHAEAHKARVVARRRAR